MIVRAPGVAAAVNDAMVGWVDITPTILDWTETAAPVSPRLSGRSLLPVLGRTGDPARDAVFASHDFHEINQYYPMRAIRTRTHSFILNLAHPLDYPIAGDVAGSPSWRAITADPTIRIGGQTQAAYKKRPAEELYDLTLDPQELVNRSDDPAYSAVRTQLAERLKIMRSETKDPWLAGQTEPYGHAAPS